MDFGWREVAAIWGAALSTIIAVMTVFPARPIFRLEPDEMGGSAKLKVVNPNQRSMLFRDLYRIRLNDDDAGLGLAYGELAIVNVGTPGAMTAFIGGQEQVEIGVNLPSERGSYLVVFLWRLDWLFPMWVPRLYVLSAKRIETMQRGTDPDRPSTPIRAQPPER